MGKHKTKKRKTQAARVTAPKTTIAELTDARDGGQIALKGYSYQMLYSCYLILSTANQNMSFRLEGVEDIDHIEYADGSHRFTHIQLKYSQNKQDASFMKGVLKNFLEVYLLDSHRFFKLVYDFPVADGNLKKLLESNLDDKSYKYWDNVLSVIKKENTLWAWSNYNLKDFLSKLEFEKISRGALEAEIEKALIGVHNIATDNLSLYSNSIKVLCLEKMTQRECVTYQEIATCISAVKMDISKGPQNPAHSWIRRVDYSKHSVDVGRGFFEGKKATPADIASGLPVHRPALEREVADSINAYEVTVIKASSGQGKTTLALQTAYAQQEIYTPYQLLFCNDVRELGNIVQWFKLRIELGEKPLVILDNLDTHLSKWNELVQLMQNELVGHYRVLVTSREIDWYNYGGDLSNIQSLHVIRPTLNENEALAIYTLLSQKEFRHR